MREVAGLKLHEIGLVYSILFIAGVIPVIPAGYVIDRFGERIGYLTYVVTIILSLTLYLHW